MINETKLIKYYEEIKSLAKKLNQVLEDNPSGDDELTIEEKNIRYNLYKAAEALDAAHSSIKYFSKAVKEGRLIEKSNGRFLIKFQDGTESYDLTCGSDLEVYIDKTDHHEAGWFSGRVEYSSDYYFYGIDKLSLKSDMKARERV